MVEKEVTLKILADVDDSQVEDLENVLQQIVNGKITVPVEADTSELEQVESDIEDVKSRLSELQAKVEVDSSEIESLESELTDLEAQKLELDVETDTSELELLDSQIADIENSLSSLQASVEVDSSEIESLESELADLESREIELTVNVNDTGLDELNNKLDELNKKLDKTESKSQSAASSVDGVGSALTAVAGAVGLDQMVTTADNINNSWNRLSLTFAGTGVSIDQLKTKQSELTASTGQTGGAIRDYFNTMGIAGVTNTDLLSQSFEALSGRAYQTNTDIGTMENALKRMVMTGTAGNRQLQSLGITFEDLGRAMGVSGEEAKKAFQSLSQEERLRVLTQAMGDGKQANEMYKNSFQGLKTQAEAAFAGLVGAIGQTILPVIIPALKLATQAINALSSGFKQLPGPVQAIIGGLGGAAMAAVTLISVLGVVGKIVSTVSGGIKALTGIMNIWSTVTKAVEVAQAALNLVMSMNPIFLVIMAIVALIAILWYLYNTNESVRAAIDGFIQALMGVGQAIYGSLMGAFAWLQGAWQNTVDFFTNGGTALSDAITGTFTWIYESIVAIFTGIFEWLTGTWQGIVDFFTGGGQTLWDTLTGVFTGVYDIIVGTLGGAFQWLTNTWNSVVNTFMTYAPLIAQVLFIMATGGIGAIVLLIANMNGMPNQIGAILQSIISRVVSWVGNLISQFTSGAQRAVSGFLSPITGLVDSVSAELSAVYSAVMSFIQPLIDAFNALGSAASWAFSFLGLGQRSPGNIYKSMKRELEWTTSFVEDDKPGLVSATANLGRDLVSSFNPRIGEGLSFDVNGFEANKQGTQSTGANGNGRQIVNNLTFNLYGDMDTEERMKKFLDYVTEYLAWDNNTAGRNMEVL